MNVFWGLFPVRIPAGVRLHFLGSDPLQPPLTTYPVHQGVMGGGGEEWYGGGGEKSGHSCVWEKASVDQRAVKHPELLV